MAEVTGEKHYELKERRSDDGKIVFKKINTGNGYSNDLTATLIDRMEMNVIESVHLQETNIQQTKVLKTATEALTEVIKTANKENEKTQNKVFWLTLVGVILAIAGVVEAVNIFACWLSLPLCVS